MARRKFSPKHTLSGTPRFVPLSDSSWREDLIPDGLDAKGELSNHVFWRYFRGETRFDLEDPELAPFIDMAKGPEIWTLRPLPLEHRQHVSWLQRQGRNEEANAFAFFRCIRHLEGASGETGETLMKAVKQLANAETNAETRKAEAAVNEALEGYALDIVDDVGGAAIRLSRDLSPVEKKASASPPGGGSPNPAE